MIRFTEEEGKLTVIFLERLDTKNCMMFEKELTDKVDSSPGKAVVFDLEKVDYVSSIFLAICMRILGKASLEKFSLINMRPNVKKVFKISGLDRQVTIK